MRGRGLGVLVAWLLSAFLSTHAWAGQPALLPKDPDARWTLVSLPLSGAPIDNEGTQLLNAPIRVVSSHRTTASHRSPADARRARMSAEHMRLLLSMNPVSETLYYPEQKLIPLYSEKSTLKF